MSWWISLNDEDGNCLEVERFSDGGTYAVGGTIEADLNITYNYSGLFHTFLNDVEGIRYLHGRYAKDTTERLKSAIDAMQDDDEEDYWKATEGNAKKALKILYTWALQHPEGKWRVN